MKRICLILLISVLIISCKTHIVSNEEDHDDLYINNVQKIEATVEKIDSIKKARRVCYIIYIKNDSMKATFIKLKCKSKGEYEDKIKEGGTYNFELLRLRYDISYDGVENDGYPEVWVGNRMIWNSKMDRLFFDECVNMCGLYIKQ